jgi:hypothetical protein
MNARLRRLALIVGFFMLVAGCGSAAAVITRSPVPGEPVDPVTTAAFDPAAPVALVVTKDGLAGVSVGSSAPRWVARGAVASPDASAVYRAEREEGDGVTHLRRVDARTGTESDVGVVAEPDHRTMQAFAVEPGGRSVALAAFEGSRTLITSFDTASASVTAQLWFEGHLEPEAFSLDRGRIFAARSFGDYYQITTLDIVGGNQWRTTGYDKTAPLEDMYGNVVQAVLIPGGSELATLYRDPHNIDHPAFVHLLDLNSGLTVCIDLPPPFGTGARGTDAIRADAGGAIEVGHVGPGAALGVSASFEADHDADHQTGLGTPVPVLSGAGAPTVPDGIGGAPGFQRLVAVVP